MNWSALLSYVIIVNYTPGPNNLICLNNGIKYGFKRSLPFMLGVLTGFTSLLLASSFFNHYINRYLPMAEGVLKVLGAAFLIYLALLVMGVDLLKPFKKDKNSDESALNTTAFTTGLVMQYVNVKAILYCLTVIGTFIAPHYSTWYQLVLASLVLGLIGFSSLVAWTLFGTVFKRFLAKYQKPVNIIMAGMLIYSALVVLGIIH